MALRRCETELLDSQFAYFCDGGIEHHARAGIGAPQGVVADSMRRYVACAVILMDEVAMVVTVVL